MLDRYKVNVPEGASGSWSVKRFTVSEDDARSFNLHEAFHGGRYITPGTYTELRHNGSIVMSDTPAEVRDHLYFIFTAEGRVLITGLGLGMVAAAVLRKKDVEHVTIVESEEDVIALVAPTLLGEFGDRVSIVHANAYEWKPDKAAHFDMAWHDIWPTICGDNYDDMKRIKRHYQKWIEKGGQDCWAWALTKDAAGY